MKDFTKLERVLFYPVAVVGALFFFSIVYNLSNAEISYSWTAYDILVSVVFLFILICILTLWMAPFLPKSFGLWIRISLWLLATMCFVWSNLAILYNF